MPYPFCTDIDLLHWEPTIFRDAAFVSQTLLSADNASLSGTTLTLPGGLVGDEAEIASAAVACIGGTVDGCFPIASVDSPTQLTISVLYDALFDDPSVPSRPGADLTGLPVTLRAFWPQRKVVSDLLLQLLDVPPARPEAVMNPEALRRPCALGALQMIYSALAATSADAAAHAVRADLYERLYRRALRAARVELDLNADGEPDCRRNLAALSLVRE